jgi:hypothetical protein
LQSEPTPGGVAPPSLADSPVFLASKKPPAVFPWVRVPSAICSNHDARHHAIGRLEPQYLYFSAIQVAHGLLKFAGMMLDPRGCILPGKHRNGCKSNGSGNGCNDGQSFTSIDLGSHQTLLSGVTYTVTLEGSGKDSKGSKSLI